MGPKISRGKAQSGSTDTPDSNRQSQWTDTPADAGNIEWDGSLIDKARWFFNLLDALPEDSKFFRLIETATVLTDKQAKIAVFHPDHARIHLERSDAPGSIDAPCMYMRNSFGPITSAASAMASPGAPPIPPSLSAMAPAEEEPAEEGEEAAPAPAPSALDAMATISAQIAALATSASPTTTTPSALSRVLGPDYAAMYTIAPHVIETTDEELAAYFLNRIGPQSVRKEYRAKANRSGRRFIVVFLEELKRAAVSSSTSTTIAERMRLLLEAGCEPSVAAWLRLTEVHSSWNRAMPPDQVIPAQQLAVMYKNVIVRMGDNADTKLTVKFNELKTESLVKGEDVSAATPRLWREACLDVLDSLSSADELAQLQGRALAAFNKDPKRTATDKDKGGGRPGGDWSKKPPKGKWTEGVNRPCNNCKELGLPGKHWDSKCPNKKDAKDQDQGTKQDGETGKGAMARASATFFDAGKTNNLDLAMLDDPEAALAALAGEAPARSLVARGASGESRASGEDDYSSHSSTTSEGHHYEDDASETPSKTPEHAASAASPPQLGADLANSAALLHSASAAAISSDSTQPVAKLSVKTAPATGELYVVSGELPTVCGVYFGHYQSDVRPVVAAALQRNGLRGSVAAHVKRCASLEQAVDALRRAGVNEVTFRGPTALPGLNVGDAIPFDDSEPECLECEYSDPEPLDADPEPEVAAAPRRERIETRLQRAAQNYPLLLFVGALQVLLVSIAMVHFVKDPGAHHVAGLGLGLGAHDSIVPIILPLVTLLGLLPAAAQAKQPLGAARGRPPDLLHLWSKLDFNPIFTSFASTTRRSRATATPPRSRTPRTPRLPALAEHAPPWLYTVFAFLCLAHGGAELYEYASIVVGGITWPTWRCDVYYLGLIAAKGVHRVLDGLARLAWYAIGTLVYYHIKAVYNCLIEIMYIPWRVLHIVQHLLRLLVVLFNAVHAVLTYNIVLALYNLGKIVVRRVIGSVASRWGGADFSSSSRSTTASTYDAPTSPPSAPSSADYAESQLLYACPRTTPRAWHGFKSTAAARRHGRALLSRKARRDRSSRPTTSRALRAVRRLIEFIVDSGCSWHVHPILADLVNVRPCHDTISGVDGKPCKCVAIGDLPLTVKDGKGRAKSVLVKNVRCVPEFTESLLSVDQLWADSQVDVKFRDICSIFVPESGDGPALQLPFVRRNKLYVWDAVVATHETDSDPRAFKATVHRPKTASHLANVSATQALGMLHRRLHVSMETIKNLGKFTADVPESVSKGEAHSCEHCVEANATRVPHKGHGYTPSHAGRLIHADIAGPFKYSKHGHYRYFLVLVDDHTRFKQVYFLKRKSDALARVRTFVAKFNAYASLGKPEPVRVVGALHTDNAGEFLSREFEEFLDEELIDQSLCPPHVHQLNGVAERAIRTIMENVRANITMANAPISFWPYLVEHAVDCLNRVTGPPGRSESSFELLTGQQPKVLPILPFGCRAYPVKPRPAYSKTDIDTRAWAGINLGRAAHTPGAYEIWLPKEGKVVCTSEVYFDEGFMPWREKGDQRVGEPLPVEPPVDVDQPPGVPPSVPIEVPDAPAATNMPEAFENATRAAGAAARQTRKVLILFSGPYRRPDGLAAFLTKLGLEVEMVDNDPEHGGGPSADLTLDGVFEGLRLRVSQGEFGAIFAAPPCSTFSVARFFKGRGSRDSGPPPVRTRRHPRGLPRDQLPPRHRDELDKANLIVARTCALLLAGWRVGTQFAVESPCDRGDPVQERLYLHKDHAPLWLMPEMIALQKLAAAKLVTFPQCSFGAKSQKQTTLAFTAGFDAWLDPLSKLVCSHATHEASAGGERVGDDWVSAGASAYPANLNHYLAQAIASLFVAPVPRPTKETTAVPEAPAPSASAAAPPSLPSPSIDADDVPAVPAAAPPARKPTAPQGSPRQIDFSNADEEDAVEALTSEEPEAPAKPKRERRAHFERGLGRPATRASKPELAKPGGIDPAFSFAFLCLAVARPFAPLGEAGFAGLAKPTSADPKGQKEAYKADYEGWRASERAELDNHESNRSFQWIDRSRVPAGRRLVKLVWVYKVKRNGKLKSRLCVQGCAMQPGVDYDQTWSGAMRAPSLRALASLAARRGMRMRRFDFVAAYLQGELEDGETVYCLPPQGYENERIGSDGKPMVAKVVKPIYGMSQAGRRWQRTLFPWMKEQGFVHAERRRPLRLPQG